jgi:hypothetical protein
MGLDLSKDCCDTTKIAGKGKKFPEEDFSVCFERALW